MCDEIRELGFDTIEASHGLSLSMMPGIIQAVEEKRIQVAGVHNFCPSPIDILNDAPDAFQFTSHRPEKRERAMRLTKETMQAAATLGASYVVLHMGSVSLMKGHAATRQLERMTRHGEQHTRAYAKLKGELIRKRRQYSSLYFERAVQALQELHETATRLNLVLGIEGRSHFEQVPDEWEMPRLLDMFKDVPSVRYWHDFGHIQRKHNLQMLRHDQYLQKLHPYIYGAHVNDVRWPARDHRAPFLGGDVDFDHLLPRFFKRSMPLTWELSPSITRDDITRAKTRWDALMTKLPE